MIAYGNLVRPASVTSVTSAEITVTLGGFPLANLEVEDPWTMMKTSTVTGTWSIVHTFGSAVNPNVIGILNHNLLSTGHSSVSIAYFSGTWQTIGTYNLNNDSDVIAAWDDVGSHTQWRFTSSAPGNPNFQIGSVFYGYQKVLATNPAASGITQSRSSGVIVERSAGGARHVSFGSDRRSSDMRLSWSRATIADRNFFEQLPTVTDNLTRSALVGILSPEHADIASAVDGGAPLFWGYVEEVNDSPRGPGSHLTGQPARYDMVVTLKGAV